MGSGLARRSEGDILPGAEEGGLDRVVADTWLESDTVRGVSGGEKKNETRTDPGVEDCIVGTIATILGLEEHPENAPPSVGGIRKRKGEGGGEGRTRKEDLAGR